ncbi:MAG: recombinase family protein [Clostridiales bacterium]|nr:recombinase family protein [Clostridiales bacterium]
MKKNRFIPYGYTMKDGRVIIDDAEAEVIRGIYEQYVSGSTLAEIAEKMTEMGVPYSEKCTAWGKARVARIIDNTKYLGNGEYGRIVDEKLFYRAEAVKASRQSFVSPDLNDAMLLIRKRLRCARCGSRMSRKANRRFVYGVEWTCANPECGAKVGISDEELVWRVACILRRIRKDLSLLDNSITEKEDDLRCKESRARFRAELESGTVDEDKLFGMITEIAQERYEKLDSTIFRKTVEIKSAVRQTDEDDGFDSELFEAVVSRVLILNGGLEIITKNNIHIGETDGS